jgi:hypothetical protein
VFWQSVYGFLTKAIRPLSQELGQILDIQWQERDSAAWGDYFLYPPFQATPDKQPKEAFQLYLNHLWFEGWKQPHFRKCGVLLAVITDRPLEIDMLLFTRLENRIILVQRRPLEG